MLSAEIHDKISLNNPPHERMEDVLTSNVFCLFRYLNNTQIPADFLRRAKNMLGQNMPISKVRWSDIFFWPLFSFENTKFREPDALVTLEEEDEKKAVVAVEAKFDAGLSNIIEEDAKPRKEPGSENSVEDPGKRDIPLVAKFSHQLADEYCGIRCGKWAFSIINSKIDPDSFLAGAEKRFLLYVTANFEVPENDIKEALETIGNPRRCGRASADCQSRGEREIFWVSWREVYSLIEEAGLHDVSNLPRSDYSFAERSLISDVFQMLQRRGIFTFRLFRDLAPVSSIKDSLEEGPLFGNLFPVPKYDSFID